MYSYSCTAVRYTVEIVWTSKIAFYHAVQPVYICTAVKGSPLHIDDMTVLSLICFYDAINYGKVN